MKNLKFAALTLVLGFIVIASCKDDDGGTDLDCATVKYSTVLSPLIASKCALPACHESGSPNGDYSTYDLMKPNLDSGKVRQRVIVDMDMPKGTVTLTDNELAQFECWLDAGHPDN